MLEYSWSLVELQVITLVLLIYTTLYTVYIYILFEWNADPAKAPYICIYRRKQTTDDS